MTAIPVFLILVAAVTPPVEVSTLNGEQHVGILERVTTEEVVLKTPTRSISIPDKDLLAIRMAGSVPPSPVTGSSSTPVAMADVRLTDGTRLRVTRFTSTTKQINIHHPQLGGLTLPLSVVQSVRLAAPDGKVDATWNHLLERTPKKDQVAVRKSDVLDHLDGVIGSLDETTLNFQLDGDDIPIKRERLFGLIFAKRESTAAKTIASMELVSGDHLAAKSLTLEGDIWTIRLASGTDLTVPSSGVQVVDFSAGKIAYLSNMEPRDIKYSPYFEPIFVWKYHQDRGNELRPLSVGNKTYAKGLSIHSKTALKYRIGGDFRRFQAVMGIDDYVRVGGNVDVIIKGDNRVLFRGSARMGQPPQPLDLDVTGVVELEIDVGYGEDELDIGDWLHLGDAKVIK